MIQFKSPETCYLQSRQRRSRVMMGYSISDLSPHDMSFHRLWTAFAYFVLSPLSRYHIDMSFDELPYHHVTPDVRSLVPQLQRLYDGGVPHMSHRPPVDLINWLTNVRILLHTTAWIDIVTSLVGTRIAEATYLPTDVLTMIMGYNSHVADQLVRVLDVILSPNG
jgi:hypothetical protein